MGIGIGLQRKERDMSKLKYLIDGKADEQFENMLWCFGGGDPEDSGGGSDVSDEDLDEELQQDIAAAAVQQSGGNIGNYSYAPSFNQNDDDNDTLIQATQNILDVASAAPQGQMQQYIDQETAMLAATRPVQQAIANVALPPQPVNLGTVAAAPQTGLGSTVTDLGGEVFDPITGAIISSDVTGMEDEYDPYAGTGQTAMDLLNYDTDDQSKPDGTVRPFAGLTRPQQQALETSNNFVAQNILAAQTQQPSGIPTTNLTGIYTFGNDPLGDVSGYSDFGPTLPGLGPTTVYTGYGDNPLIPAGQGADTGSDNTVPPVTNPMTGTEQCPDGYTFDEDLQACRRKTKRELQADSGTGGGSSTASGDMFYRRTSLDDAPANLPGGFNFADANRNFTQSFAFRPGFYSNPMDTTGFTKLL